MRFLRTTGKYTEVQLNGGINFSLETESASWSPQKYRV